MSSDRTLTPKELAGLEAASGEADTWAPDAAVDPADEPTTPPDLPTLIAATARYRPLGPIGEGGMGAVWRVQDTALERTVALKVIRPDRQLNRAALEPRFREEAQVTAQLQHPAIVPVYDIGRLPGGALFYTMQEVAGEPLDGPIERVHAESGAGPWRPDPQGWTWVRLVGVVRTVAEAVGLAHARGVLHRDLKPANIVVGARGQVFVLDWGLAKVLGRSDPDQPAPVRSLRSGSSGFETRPGAIAGTWGYMAPEQARGELASLSPASDVYALGAVLYRVLTGKTPCADPAVHTRAIADAGARGRLPEPLAHILRGAMAEQPGDRPPDGQALALALTTWLEGARAEERTRNQVMHAEAALATLRRDEAAAADGVLARLLDAEGRPTARAQDDVAPTEGAAAVIEVLRAADVLTRSPEGQVRIADPALVASWPRLAALAADAEGRQLAARVREAARTWAQRDRARDWLASGDERAALAAWAGPRSAWLTPAERDWLQASAEAEARGERRRRARLQGAAAVALLVAAAMALLWLRAEGARDQAERSREEAEAAEQVARGRRLLAEGHAMLADAFTFEALALYRAAATLLPSAPTTQALVRDIAATGRSAHALPIHQGDVRRLRVSPDGRWVASVSDDGTVRVHSLVDGRATAELETGAWSGLQWLDDGRLAIASESAQGFRMDPASGAVEGPFGGEPGAPILDLRPSDGRAVVGAEAGLAFADDDTTRVSHPGLPTIGFFSPDSRHLVTLAMHARPRLHDGATLEELATLPIRAGIKTVRPVGPGAMVVFSTDFGTPPEGSLVRYAAPERIHPLSALTGTPWTWTVFASAAAGNRLAGAWGPRLTVVDAGQEQPRVAWTAEPHGTDLTALAFSPTGRWLASAAADGSIAVHDAATGATVTRWRGSGGTINGLEWTPDGAGLVSASADGRLLRWSPGLDHLGGLLSCGGAAVRTPVVPAAESPEGWAYLDGERLCWGTADAPAQGRASPGSWRHPGPGLDPDTVVAIRAADGAPHVLTRGGGTQPIPTDRPPPVHGAMADRIGQQWILQLGAGTMFTGVARDGARTGGARSAAGPARLMAATRRLVVAPRSVGARGLRLVDLDASDDAPATRVMEDEPRVDVHTMVVTDDARGRLYVLIADQGIRTLDAVTGARLSDLPDPLSGGLRITGAGDWLLATSGAPAVRAWRLGDVPAVAWTVSLSRTPTDIRILPEHGVAVISAADSTRVLDLETGALRLRLPAAAGTSLLESGYAALATAGEPAGVGLWDLRALPADPGADAGERTNLRVCRESHTVVPVTPYPATDTVWAPPEACGG